MKEDDMTVEDMRDHLRELYREKFGGSLEELREKVSNPATYPFPKSSPTHHWLECENCGHRMMAVKSLMGIFCAKCKAGSMRAVEEASNPEGLNPGLDRCTIMGITEDKDIEIHFQDTADCLDEREEYEEILKAALGGGETIYKTLK